MPIEKQEKIESEGKASSDYDTSTKILTDVGFSKEEAYDLVQKSLKRFYKDVAPDMVLRSIASAIYEEVQEKKRRLDPDEMRKIAAKVKLEFVNQFRSDPGKKEKTIYKGLGEVEIKESSKN